MKNNNHYIITIVVIVIIQILSNNYLNLGLYLYPALLPFIILKLPFKIRTVNSLIIAFCLGLLTDILSNGILGLNAASLTFVGLMRQPLLNISVNQKDIGRNELPNFKMGIYRYMSYLTILYFVYLTVYIGLDMMSFSPISFTLIKIICSLVLNIILCLILEILLYNRENINDRLR